MFPQTLYLTPDNAGDAYIYDEDHMIKLIQEVKTVCGYDFTIEDCTELTLVGQHLNYAIYETPTEQQIKITELNGEFKAMWF